MTKITIVMPAYNVENYIKDSINSVILQTYTEWELIIVNDGSTDNTQNIVESFTDERIRLINQVNKGVSAARNRGLSEANGKYISFLDSDDYYSPTYMEMMVQPLEKGYADMVFCKFQEIDNGKVLLESPRDVNVLYSGSFIQHLQVVKNPLHSMGIMYKLALIQKKALFFNESYSYGEDLEFVLLMSFYSKVSFIPEYLYFYLYRGGSLSRRALAYKDLLGELDSLYRFKDIIDASNISNKKNYYQYILSREKGNLNNIRRYFWGLLKKKKFNKLKEDLEFFEKKYNQQFSVHYSGLKKYTDGVKVKILRSHSKLLWYFFSIFPI